MIRKFQSRTPHLLGQGGQITIMIGIMMSTFILLFMFVVNIGMLVNAKINLQNAADLAAYAGAAVQARQLNQISYLNYEMRRQYKKFLFRYYVVGNMAQACQPGSTSKNPALGSNCTSGQGLRRWSPDGLNSDYGIPAVCISYHPRDVFCQLPEQESITIVDAAPLDQISKTLEQQLKALEQLRQKNCQKIGQINQQVLIYWLYNTRPDMSFIPSGAGSEEYQTGLNVVKNVSAGLGLVPREFILMQRIKTLESYVNQETEKEVTLSRAQALGQGQDPSRRERTIQAFYSAYNTLGNHIFEDSDKISLTELMPSGDQKIKLEPILGKFDAYFVDFIVPNNTTAAGEQNCTGVLKRVPATQIPVGVSKDPSLLTYYALRLDAEAKILFSPFGNLKLRAYAAAMPFGSRIGPPLQFDTAFLNSGAEPSVTAPGSGVNGGERTGIPNLPLATEDGTGKGWNQVEVLEAFYNQLKNAGGDVTTVSLAPLLKAYQAAMVPNPWEAGKYNILGLGKDPFENYFDDFGYYTFWAPIFSPEDGDSGTVEQKIKDALAAGLGGAEAAGPGNRPDPLISTLSDQIQQYILQDMATGKGEDGETINVVRLRNPFMTHPLAAGESLEPINIDGKFMIKSPDQTRTSWNNVRYGEYSDQGRIGYSVKFVSFSTLSGKTGGTSNGSDAWENPPVGDALFELEKNDLQH